MSYTIEAEGLTKSFGATRVLEGLDLGIEAGEVFALLGPNGAGKTTTMRAIFGLVELDTGAVLWDGRPIGPVERLRFGYMPEERGLYPRMRVREQLAYLGRLHGLNARDADAAASEWLTRLGLADRADAKVVELSHGNQQRAQLAAALVHTPELLVLDEPFAGLDPVAVRTLAQVLRDEAARGVAVLFSSHQLDLVEEICEEVAIIDRGRIVAEGNLDALRRASERRRIALRLDGAPPGWEPEIRGADVVDRTNGDLRLLVDRDVDPQAVLAAAERTAPVIGFSYGPPSLAELFLELVER